MGLQSGDGDRDRAAPALYGRVERDSEPACNVQAFRDGQAFPASRAGSGKVRVNAASPTSQAGEESAKAKTAAPTAQASLGTRVFQNTAAQLIGRVISIGFSAVTSILLARYLGKEKLGEYGAI